MGWRIPNRWGIQNLHRSPDWQNALNAHQMPGKGGGWAYLELKDTGFGAKNILI